MASETSLPKTNPAESQTQLQTASEKVNLMTKIFRTLVKMVTSNRENNDELFAEVKRLQTELEISVNALKKAIIYSDITLKEKGEALEAFELAMRTRAKLSNRNDVLKSNGDPTYISHYAIKTIKELKEILKPGTKYDGRGYEDIQREINYFSSNLLGQILNPCNSPESRDEALTKFEEIKSREAQYLEAARFIGFNTMA